MDITQQQTILLEKYNSMLVEKNKVMNLTAHKTAEESWLNNVQDSLLFAEIFSQLNDTAKVLDIGSGGGCPAIPLWIAAPKQEMTMLDSTLKKVDFLNVVVSELGLQKIAAVHARAEDFAHSTQCREKFDCVTARAVAALPTLLEYTLPLLKTGGVFFAFKGKNWQQEVEAAQKALKILGGEVVTVHTKELTPNIERALLVIKKVKNTDVKYPRSGNAPRVKPL